MTKNIKGIFYLVLAAFLYSIMPVLIRLLGAGKMPPMSQVFLRYIFAFIGAVIYFYIFKKSKIKIHKQDILLLLLITVFGYSLTNLLFTYGILLTQVSNVLFLFYCYGIITPVLGYFFLKEKINKFVLISLVISFIALMLLYQPNSIPTWKIGSIFAILSALGQSMYLILRKKLINYSAPFMMLANTFVGVVVLGMMSLIVEKSFYFNSGIFLITPQTWIVTILFGLDNFIAWLCMTKGFELFKASTGSLILLTEIVFGIIFAFMFFREIPTFLTLIGGLLILFSSVIIILKNK